MKNVLVVFNINAGRKQAIKYKKRLLSFLLKRDLSFKIINISMINTIDKTGFDTIIAIGGDGTVSKVIPYIINTDKVLGIIPCGTANLLAAKLGIPANLKDSLNVIDSNNISTIDSIKINDNYGILRFGMGYDADIICKTPQSLKNKFGYFSYFIAGILFALRLKNKKYNLFYNNIHKKVEASCIIIANANNMYKNIVSLSKKSSLTDNLADIFILKTKNPLLFFYEFLRIIFNIKTSNSRAEYFQVSNIKISNTINTAHIDGEKAKVKGDIQISIINNSIKVFSKKHSPIKFALKEQGYIHSK